MKWARQAFGIVGTGRMKFLYNRRMEKKEGKGDYPPCVKSEGKRGKFDFLALVEMFGCRVRFLPPHLYKSGGWLG